MQKLPKSHLYPQKPDSLKNLIGRKPANGRYRQAHKPPRPDPPNAQPPTDPKLGNQPRKPLSPVTLRLQDVRTAGLPVLNEKTDLFLPHQQQTRTTLQRIMRNGEAQVLEDLGPRHQ